MSHLEIRSESPTEFWKLIQSHVENIFDEKQIVYQTRQFLSNEERTRLKELNNVPQGEMSYHFIARHQGELVGWSWGRQDGPRSVYMVNSAVLENYRRKGFYTEILNFVISHLLSQGVEKITSRHHATNNEIIIPKLKRGFIIDGFEISEIFGVLVNLSFYKQDLHRKLMKYRAGELLPSAEIQEILKL